MFQHKTALTIMRAQPPHVGHFSIITRMLKEAEYAIVGLGSIQEMRTFKNPFSYIERKNMLTTYFNSVSTAFSNRLKIVGIEDIWDRHAWPDWVFNSIQLKLNNTSLESIDAYYCGTKEDGIPFSNKISSIVIVDRTKLPFVSGTMVREMLHYKHPDWKKYIPHCNWECVENVLGDLYAQRVYRNIY